MDKYKIVTDATCDLSADMAAQLQAEVIPMHFRLGNKEYAHYPDEREMKLTDFYTALKLGQPASTSQITPAEYTDFFEPILRDGFDIIYIALSSGLSGTHGASCIAALDLKEKYPDRRIKCIDSLCASIGEGLLVLEACRRRLSGAGFDEVVEYIEDNKRKICHWFMVDDMEQLKRGGRINSVEATLAGALHIVPILSLNEEGRLEVKTKMRGVKKALSFMKARLAVDGYKPEEQTVLIAHGNCPERAEELLGEITSEGLAREAYVSSVGPVIGSHTGTGMCALVFMGENYQNY